MGLLTKIVKEVEYIVDNKDKELCKQFIINRDFISIKEIVDSSIYKQKEKIKKGELQEVDSHLYILQEVLIEYIDAAKLPGEDEYEEEYE